MRGRASLRVRMPWHAAQVGCLDGCPAGNVLTEIVALEEARIIERGREER